ncbi:uncharacterized protein At3g17950 [Punica granatum]|uniref:Uncharacterized protein n=2 Tax=Punica granatum TaxID=22663 RepID=A0A2I0ILC8_PUNGR|nr:uncharacterized protein At3g17950 [Punica granatum]PKI44176.1 hypothetical protein CRG98_035413 [Punica granatum]
MQDPANELLPPPSSPTASSISSSDLDTESTGSFFHDRSTTLGTLMGVSFPAITFRAPSQHRDPDPPSAAPCGSVTARKSKRQKKAPPPFTAAVVAERRRRRWWRLCRDDGGRPASLGEFLEIERRFGDGAFYEGAPAAELQGSVAAQPRNGRVLFADGRVLPPQPADADEETPSAAALRRCLVSLTGTCSGGVG